MRRAIVAAVLGLGLFLAGCDSPTVPGRLEPYDFSLPVSEGPALVFHWPVGSAIRVFVADTATGATSLRAAFEEGARVWNAVAPYGEFRLERAERADAADAVLGFASAPRPVDMSGCPAGPGVGVTTFCLTGSEPRLQAFPLLSAPSSPSPVRMVVSIASYVTADPERFRRIVAHELGHVLGIFRHAPDPGDLMWGGDLEVGSPSEADRETVQVLYHTHSDILP